MKYSIAIMRKEALGMLVILLVILAAILLLGVFGALGLAVGFLIFPDVAILIAAIILATVLIIKKIGSK